MSGSFLFPDRQEKGWDHGGPAPGETPRCHLDASTTVNPFPSPLLVARLRSALEDAGHYPDPAAGEALRAIGKRFSLSPACVAAGGGATLLLYALLGSGSFSRIVSFSPVFSEYLRAADVSGRSLLAVPPARRLSWEGEVGAGLVSLFGGRDLPWGIDWESLPQILAGDLVVLVNPVNPTGQEISRQEVLALFRRVSGSGGALLVDESFQDFLGNRSSVLEQAGEGPLYVLRSLTKITGLPGVRAGFLAGPEREARRLRERLGPWALGTVEQSLVLWTMEEERQRTGFGYRPEAKELLCSELFAAGWAVLPGEGPFVLASPNMGPRECREKVQKLRERGVRLRLASGFGLSGGEALLRLGFEALSRPGELLGQFWGRPGERAGAIHP